MYKRRRHGLQDSSHPDHSIQSIMQIFVSREKITKITQRLIFFRLSSAFSLLRLPCHLRMCTLRFPLSPISIKRCLVLSSASSSSCLALSFSMCFFLILKPPVGFVRVFFGKLSSASPQSLSSSLPSDRRRALHPPRDSRGALPAC